MITKLKNIAQVKAGNSAPNKDTFSSSGIPFVRAGSLEFLVRNESIDNCEKIGEAEAKSLKLNLFPRGSILFAKSGMSAKMGRVYQLPSDAFIVSHLAVIIPDESIISSSYLKYYFIGKPPMYLIRDEAYPSIRLADIEEIEIDLPDLETQYKIVAILDKASALVQKRQQTIDLLDELLRAQFLEMFGEAPINPNGWEYKELGTLLDFLTSGSRGWAKYYNDEGDIFLRINNLGYNELLLDDLVFVNAPESAEARRTEVQCGDVLLSITADLGRTAVIPDNFVRAFVNQHIAILRPNETINPYFLSEYISSEGGRHLIIKYSKGAAKSGLNFNDIKSLKIFIPPKDLQDRFEKFFKKNKSLKSGLKSNFEVIQSLFNSTLQRAFSGKLDLNVSVELDALLEEIDLQNSKNDLFSIITNEEYLLSLVNRLNNQEFESQDLYDKAKHVAFQLLKEEERLAQQYDEQTKSLKLVVK